MSVAEPTPETGTYRARDFVMVDLELVDQLDGSWDAAALAERIRYRAGDGWWCASRSDMQAELRMTEHRVKVALALLRDRRVVQSQRVSPFDPTLQWRPWYDGDPTAPDAVTATAPDAVTVVEPHAVTTVLKDVEELPPYSPPEGGELFAMPGPQQQPQPARAELAVVDRFAEWYDLYPRKAGRAAAERAWVKAIKSTDAQAIIAGLVRQLPALRDKVARGESRFVKHPATWLNGGCWDDELDAPQVDRQAAHGSVGPTIAAVRSGRVVDPWAAAGLDSPATGGALPIDSPANERNAR